MRKGDIYYIIFKTNYEIEKKESLNNLPNKKEIKLIIKRTFETYKGGKREVYINQILDKNLNVVPDNSFNWNGLKCKIKKDERWFYFSKKLKYKITLDLNVIDYFNKIKIISFNMEDENAFENIKNTLLSIEKFGSHKSVIEINKLKSRLFNLEKRLNYLENNIPNITIENLEKE